MTKDDREVVSAVHDALSAKVGSARYAAWFGRGVRLEVHDATLRVVAADAFRLDYLRRSLRTDLLAVARETLGPEASVEFRLDATAGQVDAAGDKTAPSDKKAAASAPDEPPPALRVVSEPPPEAPAAPTEHRLPRRQFASLHDFIASEANKVAYSAAQTAAARPGTYSPLTFVGPPGSGKTHLLEGIWRRVRESRTLHRVIYLTAEQFTNQFLDALRQSGTPSFRRKIRDVELLLVDDVQFFGGKQTTLVELVHTIDTLLREGRQLVFSADRPPLELRSLGSELGARLAGGLVCSLEPADFAARLGMLRQSAARQGLDLPDDVQQWLAAQLDGDARRLAGALHRLRAARDAHGRPIDLDFAQRALDDLLQAARRPVRLPDIVEAVSDVFGVSPGELQAGGKTAGATLPRMLVMFLARKWTRAALSEISRTVGRKSHSTVVSAQHKVAEWLADGKTVALAHGPCRVEDAIKRVEAQLRLA